MIRRSLPLLLAAAFGCARQDGETADTVAAATPNVVVITASDFAFQLPDTIPAGMTTLKLVVDGTNLHHATIDRIVDGKTFADYMEAMRTMTPATPPPTWVVPVGGPNPPAPGDTMTVTQMLEPGVYSVVCFVDTPDKVPHVAKGMVKELVVVPASTAPAPPPAADVTISMRDYTWDITPALSAGRHVLKVDNASQQPHEFFIFRLDSAKTVDDFMKFLDTYAGPPPGVQMGGLAAMAPGRTSFVEVDLTPGNYVMICFIPAPDGKPHFAHGMLMPFTIS